MNVFGFPFHHWWCFWSLVIRLDEIWYMDMTELWRGNTWINKDNKMWSNSNKWSLLNSRVLLCEQVLGFYCESVSGCVWWVRRWLHQSWWWLVRVLVCVCLRVRSYRPSAAICGHVTVNGESSGLVSRKDGIDSILCKTCIQKLATVLWSEACRGKMFVCLLFIYFYCQIQNTVWDQ